MADTRDAEAAHDPKQGQLDAAEALARSVAGDDDQRFVLVFHSLVNVLDSFDAHPSAVEQARSILLRTAEPMVTRGRRGLGTAGGMPGPQPDSLYSDPVFIENCKKLIPDRERIIGGIPTSAYADCVAVGSPNRWCCTGTLVAPNVVVTAAHCVASCSTRVFLGEDVSQPSRGEVVDVQERHAHPRYGPPSPTFDIAVLILSRDVSVASRAIAKPEMLDSASGVRLAGYGNTDVYSSGGYGKRRMVDVPLASADPKYGAQPQTEFVAGAPFLDRDSCNGDSGGPAYAQSGRRWYLAGATSRATASTIRPCGDGGIYTRVPAFEEWVRSVPGGHWG